MEQEKKIAKILAEYPVILIRVNSFFFEVEYILFPGNIPIPNLGFLFNPRSTKYKFGRQEIEKKIEMMNFLHGKSPSIRSKEGTRVKPRKRKRGFFFFFFFLFLPLYRNEFSLRFAISLACRRRRRSIREKEEGRGYY